MADTNLNNSVPTTKPESKPNTPTPNKKKPKKINIGPWLIPVAIITFLIALNVSNGNASFDNTREISVSQFNTYLNLGQVDKIVVYNSTEAEIFLKTSALTDKTHQKISKNEDKTVNKGPHYFFNTGDDKELSKKLETAQREGKISYYKFEERAIWTDILSSIFPILLIVVIWIIIMRRMSGSNGPGGQLFNIGKSRARLFDEKADIKTTFKDVAGLEGAKEEIQEIVEFLKNPQKYTNLGGKIPKGALLVGPPGTGKTLLAKAVAGEAEVPFFSLSGSDFVEMFVGVGASRVRDLFKQAKEKSPSIIFIDEIDAVGRARGKNTMSGGNDERENTLNQLLTEMDGFGTDTSVIVLAATNRADVLDKALMRAGRFDRQIFVDLPDIKEREAIFNVHLTPLKKIENLDVSFLAKQTPGFSGADIANLCNEAALIAARNNKEAVDKQDFLDAVDRIVGGLEKKNKIVSPDEKRAIAIHEAGHATVSWMLEHAAPLVKVTIVPRGQSLGAAWYLPEERLIVRPDQMLDEMCATMGGRAAEKVTFNTISTGALSDLEKVTKQARAMVTIYGLNDKIGNVTYYDSSGQNEYNFSKPYSEDTAITIDKEISALIESQYQRAIQILEDNKDKLNLLANILIEKEVIFKDDLEKIFGKRPFEKFIEEPKVTENVVDNDEEIITTTIDEKSE